MDTWVGDGCGNGHGLGALRARARLVPITTPAYSPQSNGLAEAFVKTFKRDYVDGAGCRDGLGPARGLAGRLPALRARLVQPRRIPGRAAHTQLLTVSSTSGSTPAAASGPGLEEGGPVMTYRANYGPDHLA